MITERYKILFCSDENYFKHLSAAIYSLLYNNQDILLDIHLFTSNISTKDFINLNKICIKYNTRLIVNNLNDSYFNKLVVRDHFTLATYYRLFAADLIQDDKCLYLDSDIIVNFSILNILNLDITNYYIAAVEDCGFNSHIELGMKSGSKYFNAGVMLINLKKWREDNIRDLVTEFIKLNPSLIKYADQCGLNAIINGRWMEIFYLYNYQTDMFINKNKYIINKNDFPIIVHYTSKSKPWHFKNKHPLKKLYWFYRNKTVYWSFIYDDFNLVKIKEKLLKFLNVK